MRNLAIAAGSGGTTADAAASATPGLRGPGIETLAIDGTAVSCGVVRTTEPAFDRRRPEHARSVLVRVRAFSCNYRDKALILRTATRAPAGRFYVVGSEFVGDVVDAGPEVSRVAVGDRVIGDNSYPNHKPDGWMPGIPTNHASREFLVLREEKVVAVPAAMPDAEAAAFSVGAQTAFSMVNKLGVREGTNVLVTAAKSNTSLFAIGALRARGANVYATSTSRRFERELLALGVRQLFCVDPLIADFKDHAELAAASAAVGGFECVVDPFYDLHIAKVMRVMAKGGRYTTCGFYDQYLNLTGGAFPGAAPNYGEALQIAMAKNIHIIGNCCGVAADLERALDVYAAGALPVAVDSVFRDGPAAGFLGRTYNASDRLGKVVYAYA